MIIHFYAMNTYTPSFRSIFNQNNTPDGTSFSLRQAPWDPTKILVHPAGYPVESQPMYSITICKERVPNVVMFRGWGGGPCDIIGDARLPKSLSSKSHLILHGQSIDMRLSQTSGQFNLESPTMGRLKWKADVLCGRNMKLHDATGRRLAQLRSSKPLGENDLEILVSHDDKFFELVLLSSLTARTMKEAETKETEVTAEILTSVLWE